MLDGRRFLWFWGVGLLVSVISAQAEDLPSAKDWIRLRSENFTIFSNASEKQTKKIALSLETFHASLDQLFGARSLQSHLPVSIVAFRNDKSFRSYKRFLRRDFESLQGVFLPDYDENLVALDARGGGLPTVYHEYTHVRNHKEDLPLWLNEGLAELYSTFEAKGSTIQLGHPIIAHLALLSAREPIPLEQLLTMDWFSHEPEGEHGRSLFYAQSWALVHYLSLQRPEGSKQLTRYLDITRSGVPVAEAIQDAFGTTPAALLEELELYLRDRNLPSRTIMLDALKVSSEIRLDAPTQEELLNRLGKLLIRMSPQSAAFAEAHFKAALQLNPQSASAYGGLGLILQKQGNHPQAMENFQKAIELDPNSAMYYFRLGESGLIHASANAPDSLPLVRKSREAYRRALELDLGLAAARGGIAWSLVFEEEIPPIEAVTALEQLLDRRAQQFDIAYQLALVLARRGNFKRAGSLFQERIASQLPAEKVLPLEQELRAHLLKSGRQLLQAGELRAALEVYEHLGTIQDPTFPERLRTELAEAETLLESQLRTAASPEQAQAHKESVRRVRDLRAKLASTP